MVTPGRFERPTSGLGNRCSIQLSYGAARERLPDDKPTEHCSNLAELLSLQNSEAGVPPFTCSGGVRVVDYSRPLFKSCERQLHYRRMP